MKVSAIAVALFFALGSTLAVAQGVGGAGAGAGAGGAGGGARGGLLAQAQPAEGASRNNWNSWHDR
jgi:hypothetical protein